MPYSSLADIEERIPAAELAQLCYDGSTDDAEAQAAAVTAVTDKAIADADAEIDGYCAGRYTTPMSPVPAIIAKFSAEIAVYNVFSRRQGAPEDWEKRYKNAIRFLENLSKGTVSIGADAPVAASSGPDAPEFSSARRVFSRRTMRGW